MSSVISWWRADFGDPEIGRIADAIRSECISQGKQTAAFEAAVAQQLEVPHVIATTSGSMALLMACLVLGIGPGDEVIVPNRTWIATAHAPHLLGAKVVLADVEPDRPLVASQAVAAAITPRTRAIIAVHLNGAGADMDGLLALGARHGIPVIEDAAQAFLSRDAQGKLGTRGHMACYSLSVAKLIATGQGGFVTTHDSDTANRLRALRTHGLDSIINPRWEQPGFNFRFTDLQAAFGLAQIERIPQRIAALHALHERYRVALAGHESVHLLPVAEGQIPLYVEALCPRRDALIAHLAEHGIEARPFYPDLDRAPYFPSPAEAPKNSRRFEAQGLFLPSGPAQKPEDIDHVLASLQAFGTRHEGVSGDPV